METAASYPLLTEVLRQEWGFKGHIISDMTHSGNSSVNNKCYENVNNRILSGCNQQLDLNGGFKQQIECKWDTNAFDGKGAPVFKDRNGNTVESYSYWFALRMNALEMLWTCANCGVMQKTLIKEAKLEFEGAKSGRVEVKLGQKFEIKVSVPEELDGATLSIDEFTPLPEGLAFENNTIKGKLTSACNVFIHVIAEKDGKKSGSSLELFAPAMATNEPGKAGCFGAVEATFSIIGVLALATIIVLFVDKQRRARA